MRTRVFVAVLYLIAAAAPALAQIAPTTAVIMNVYRSGVATPAAAPQTVAMATVNCNLPYQPPPTGIVANPNAWTWENEADAALPETSRRRCQVLDPPNGLLSMLALDGATQYQSTLTKVTAAGNSPEGPRGNLFTRPGEAPSVAPARLFAVRLSQ